MTDTNISSVQSAVSASARVVPPDLTRLFSPSRQEVWVPLHAVPRFLAEGYTTQLFDPRAAANELLAALGALTEPVKAVCQDAIDGEVYAANVQTAYEVVQNFANKWAALTPALFENPESKPGVMMTRFDAATQTEVDPNQVELYEAQGWRKVEN